MTRRIQCHCLKALLCLLLLQRQAYSLVPAQRFVVPPTTTTSRCVLTPNCRASLGQRIGPLWGATTLYAEAASSSSSSSANQEDSTTTSTNNKSSSSSLLGKTAHWIKQPRPQLTSTAWLIALDVAFRQVFLRAKIRFPSSLAGCGVVLVALLLLARVQATSGQTDATSALYRQLQPGAALLAQWLPVFFVPSLVTLPLAEGLGSAADLIKVTAVLLGGFFVTLFTTAHAVVAVRRGSNVQDDTNELSVVNESVKGKMSQDDKSHQNGAKTSSTAPSTKPFSGKLLKQLTLAAVLSGLLAQAFVGAAAAQFLTGLCFLASTLASFVFGARLPTALTKMVHPVVTCTAMTWGVVAVLANLMGHSFRGLLRCYRTGNVWTGAGDVLLFLLGPAVVSLAVSIFDRRKLVRDNAAAVATAVGVATVGGVGGTALAVRLCGIGIPAVRLSLLSRNITSPLAMAMASLLGADVSLAVSMVVLTGLVGANFGASLLTAAGITDPVARGLSMGAAAHGLGTAALAGKEPTAFSFSAIAMALVASAATVTVSIPFLRRIVLEMALG